MKQGFWSKEKSVAISRWITVGFVIALIILDIFGYFVVDFIVEELLAENRGLQGGITLMVCLYLCSVPGYILLNHLYKLLRNIEKGCVFEEVNVYHLRVVSWCCAFAAVICLVSATVWTSLIVVSLAAGFMALIVHVVKNIIEEAMSMKDELDFTV